MVRAIFVLSVGIQFGEEKLLHRFFDVSTNIWSYFRSRRRHFPPMSEIHFQVFEIICLYDDRLGGSNIEMGLNETLDLRSHNLKSYLCAEVVNSNELITLKDSMHFGIKDVDQLTVGKCVKNGEFHGINIGESIRFGKGFGFHVFRPILNIYTIILIYILIIYID